LKITAIPTELKFKMMHRNQLIWLKIQTLAFRYSDRVEKAKVITAEDNWISS